MDVRADAKKTIYSNEHSVAICYQRRKSGPQNPRDRGEDKYQAATTTRGILLYLSAKSRKDLGLAAEAVRYMVPGFDFATLPGSDDKFTVDGKSYAVKIVTVMDPARALYEIYGVPT